MTWAETVTLVGTLVAAGHWLVRGLRRLFNIVPPFVLDFAITHVEQAADLYVENAVRRNWVLTKMLAAGIPENMARLAIEMAVQAVKAGAKSAAGAAHEAAHHKGD